jgi:sterol desaturase/sphingolipid hydroxylase (fatty acid hydroxylase superfamily)
MLRVVQAQAAGDFAHHLQANANFAVVDFFWDRMIGTYRKPDRDIH